MTRMIAAAYIAVALTGCADLIGITDPTTAVEVEVALSDLQVSRGVLSPAFDPDVTHYDVALPYMGASIGITATVSEPSIEILIAGSTAQSATPADVALPIGSSTIEIVAHTASNLTRRYEIVVDRKEPDIGFVLGTPIPGVGMITTVAAVEVDGNAKPDLVFTTYDGDVGVVVNMGTVFVGRTYLPMVATRSVAVAEVTGDVFPDLLISDNTFQIARGKGDGTFEPPMARAFADAGVIALGALDTDGRPDVMVGDGPGRVTAMLNDGASMVMGPSWQPGNNPGEPRAIVNAQLDAFGGEETIVLDAVASTITVFSFANAAFAMSQVPLGAAAAPRELVAADFDTDARADIAWIDPFTGNVVVQTKFPNWTRTPFHVGSSPRALTVADVDGDGARDLVVLDNQQLVVLFNDGTAGFTLKRFPELGAGAVDVEVVDIDRDGRQDLIFANQTSSMTYARGVLQ